MSPRVGTILEHRLPITTQHCGGVRRAGVECLPDHEGGFAVACGAINGKSNIGADRDVAGYFLPDVVESVGGFPDVPGPGDRILAKGGIEDRMAGCLAFGDRAFVVKRSDRGGEAERRQEHRPEDSEFRVDVRGS